MKYDSQLAEAKNVLPSARNILIALPANASIDQLASGLALFLTLQSQGKEVSIVCDDNITVGQSHLFGVDHIQKNIPSTEGGNLTLTLEGVAASDNSIPALEKLDWFAENNNLNLVFHVLPGQTFQPGRIIPHYQGSGFNLIFTIGALNLNALGNIYSQNQQVFSGTHIVNIDIQSANTSFGQTNVLDPQASSLSEVLVNVIQDLGLSLSQDAASNLIAGIFDATANLTNDKATADAFMAMASCLRVGGKKPSVSQTQSFDWSGLMPKNDPVSQPQVAQASIQSDPAPVANEPVHAEPVAQTEPVVQSQPEPVQSQPAQAVPEYAMPSVSATLTQDENQPSPEERPAGEGVISETVEPEWLTPKIFKGSSLG